jgi:hypothetical protein
MPKAEEYRQYARECLETAANATTEHQRRQFLDMARAWTLAALRLEPVGFGFPMQTGPTSASPLLD